MTQEDILEQVREHLAILRKPYVAAIEEEMKQRGRMDRVVEIEREWSRVRELAVRPFVDMLNLLPSDPIIVHKDEI